MSHYGEIQIERHLYQTSKGGTTYCPLERDARIILTSTPKFASQVSHKITNAAASSVVEDLASISKNVAQLLSDVVSSVVRVKEEVQLVLG